MFIIKWWVGTVGYEVSAPTKEGALALYAALEPDEAPPDHFPDHYYPEDDPIGQELVARGNRK